MSRREPLTAQHTRFVTEYLKCGSPGLACQRAGFVTKYPYHRGYRLYHRPEIRDAIERGKQVALDKINVKAQRVIDGLSRIAFASIDDVVQFGADGSIRMDPAAPRGRMSCVSVTIEKGRISTLNNRIGRRITITLPSKLRALVSLAKLLGMLR